MKSAGRLAPGTAMLFDNWRTLHGRVNIKGVDGCAAPTDKKFRPEDYGCCARMRCEAGRRGVSDASTGRSDIRSSIAFATHWLTALWRITSDTSSAHWLEARSTDGCGMRCQFGRDGRQKGRCKLDTLRTGFVKPDDLAYKLHRKRAARICIGRSPAGLKSGI